MLDPTIQETLQSGTVIPAHPLALTAERRLDEQRQRALTRYYLDAGVGGLAVGVHTTQFAIHDPQVGLYEPVLALAAEEIDRHATRPIVRVAGLVGRTEQAVREASVARDLGYHVGLLSLAALAGQDDPQLLNHCRAVAEVLPIFGFYLQPAVGGIELPYPFWVRFTEIENVVAIKVAAFDRYRTLDVIRSVVDAGRDDIALYTGNDDHIVLDLLTPFRFPRGTQVVTRRFVGGLLGHWAVWTRRAVQLFDECRAAAAQESTPASLLIRANEVTDCNAAIFDAANGFTGCIPGIHEVLRRQGLLEGTWCLDPEETLSPGQVDEIDRVCGAYPWLTEDAAS